MNIVSYDHVVGVLETGIMCNGSLWLRNSAGEQVRTKVDDYKNQGYWFLSESQEGACVSVLAEKNESRKVIRAGDFVELEGEMVSGFDLYELGVKHNGTANWPTAEVKEPGDKYFSEPFEYENHVTYGDRDTDHSAYVLGCNQHRQQVLVWGSEELRDRIIYLLNTYGDTE